MLQVMLTTKQIATFLHPPDSWVWGVLVQRKSPWPILTVAGTHYANVLLLDTLRNCLDFHFLVTLNWYFWYFPTTPSPPPWVVVSSFKYPLTQLLGAHGPLTLCGVRLWAPECSRHKSPLAVCIKTVSHEWFGVSPLLNQNVGESSHCGSFNNMTISLRETGMWCFE